MTSVTNVKEGRKSREAGMPTVVLEMTMVVGTREGKRLSSKLHQVAQADLELTAALVLQLF